MFILLFILLSEKNKRTMLLSESLFEDFNEFSDKIYDYDPEVRLFPVDKFYLKNEIKRGSSIANIKKIRIHDLRHSHASL